MSSTRYVFLVSGVLGVLGALRSLVSYSMCPWCRRCTALDVVGVLIKVSLSQVQCLFVPSWYRRYCSCPWCHGVFGFLGAVSRCTALQLVPFASFVS